MSSSITSQPKKRKPSPEKRIQPEPNKEKEEGESWKINMDIEVKTTREERIGSLKSSAVNLALLVYLIYSEESSFLNRYVLFIIKNTYQVCHSLIKKEWLKKMAFYISILVIIYIGMIAYSTDSGEGSEDPLPNPIEFKDSTREILISLTIGLLCLDMCHLAF